VGLGERKRDKNGPRCVGVMTLGHGVEGGSVQGLRVGAAGKGGEIKREREREHQREKETDITTQRLKSDCASQLNS